MKIIIVGAGQVGFHIASRLAHENKDVVVIDTDPAAVARLAEKIDVEVVVGSGSSPMLLEEVGIRESDILLAVTDSDEVNLVACLAADIIAPAVKKLARIRKGDYDHYHTIFKESAPHIDAMINPEIEVVILTGHGTDKDRDICMDLGAFAYLEKPVDIDVLSDILKRANEHMRQNLKNKKLNKEVNL